VRRAAAIGFTLLMLVALPDSARSDTAKSIVEAAAIAAVMGIVCSTTAILAEDEIDPEDYARRGWVIGAAGSYALETFEDEANSDYQRILGPTSTYSVDDSFGFIGQVGYRCHRRFSVEVETEWLHGFNGDLNTAGVVQLAHVHTDPIVVTANAKGYFLTGRYQPFLQVGGGAMTVKTSVLDPVGLGFTGIQTEDETSFVMRFGGGIDLYATKNVVVSLGADYVLPLGNLDALDYISVSWGFQYRF
jgi:opacity protein-like surface antigen